MDFFFRPVSQNHLFKFKSVRSKSCASVCGIQELSTLLAKLLSDQDFVTVHLRYGGNKTARNHLEVQTFNLTKINEIIKSWLTLKIYGFYFLNER